MLLHIMALMEISPRIFFESLLGNSAQNVFEHEGFYKLDLDLVGKLFFGRMGERAIIMIVFKS